MTFGQRLERQHLVDDARHRVAGRENSTMSIGSGMSASLAIDLAAEDLLAGMAGIDREDLKALGQQVFQHEEARPDVVGRGADHGDGAHRIEDAGDVGVVVAVVVHARQRDAAVRGDRECRIVRDFPEMAVGVGEIAVPAAPEGASAPA